MTAVLRRKLRGVGAAMAKAGRVRLPPGAVAAWSEADVARAGVLLDTCGAAALARLGDEDLAALCARLRGGERGEG
jgi:hypothetical protein